MNTKLDPQVSSPVDTQPPQAPAVSSQIPQPVQMAQTPQPAPQQAPQVAPQPAPAQQGPDGRIIAGVVLIAFGVLALLATFTQSSVFGLSILPSLGILFIVWGLVARLPGVMIPGGILTGLGLGTLLSQLAFDNASGEVQGGIIVLGLGFGFLMIMPLIMIISTERHWWALIPGGILTVVGIGLLIGGAALDVLAVLGRLWPIVPIVIGIILLWQILRKR